MLRCILGLSLGLLTACLAGCVSNGDQATVPPDPQLREQLAEVKARIAAKRLIAKGWEDWNWQTHNAGWEDDVLVLRNGFNPPIRVNVPEADAVRIRKFGEDWYHEVRVHITRPEPFVVWLRADTLDDAKALVNALLLLGAREG